MMSNIPPHLAIQPEKINISACLVNQLATLSQIHRVNYMQGYGMKEEEMIAKWWNIINNLLDLPQGHIHCVIGNCNFTV